MNIVFATMNGHKLREAEQILGDHITLLSPADFGITGDIPENGTTLESNAIQKAEFVYNITSENCFSDDTGLEIEALNGEPGVFSARYAGEGKNAVDNMNKVLRLMEGKENRKARFRCVIALIFNSKQHLFEGIVNGKIAHSPSGSEGFGYDPIFIPDGYEDSFAVIPAQEKNHLSHRGIALRRMRDFLAERRSE